MDFLNQLRTFREEHGISLEVVAQKLNIKAKEYEDRENGRVSVNFPEKYGMLVLLGMEEEEAIRVAKLGIAIDSANIEDRINELIQVEKEDPFVYEKDGHFVFSERMFYPLEYRIPQMVIKSKGDILEHVDILSSKAWITPRHIQKFVGIASQYLLNKT